MIALRRLCIIFIVSCFMTFEVFSMVEDNRFFPEFPRNYSRTWCYPSAFFVDGFIMTGNDAFDHEEEDKDIGIFETFGLYNENKVADAIVALGLPDPFDQFPTLQRFRGQNILWDMDAKIQTQGFAVQWDQHIWRYLWMGGSVFFMHLYSRNDFNLNIEKTVTPLVISFDDQLRLDELRRAMNVTLGLQPSVFKRTGFSDIDFYFRIGNIWEYLYKFKRVDVGLKVGTMIPSGVVRKIINPASVPFGGDGHWGIYSAVDFEIELKEDWKVGGHARINKRFAKTKEERLPVVGKPVLNEHEIFLSEQQLWGGAQGRADINPGITSIFSPYARLENIREGFGLQAGYTIAHHFEDSWADKRPVPIPPVFLEENEKRSKWTSEFVTVDAFFDCAQLMLPYGFAPILSFKWDVPVKLFAAKGAAKTNRVSLGIKLNY